MLWSHVLNCDVSAGSRRGYHISTGFNLIRNYRICSPVHFAHAANFYHVCTRAPDVRSHGIEEIGKIDDMRFLCRVLDDCESLGSYGGKHYIDSRAHRHHVERYARAFKSILCRKRNYAVAETRLCPQRFKSLEMLVDRSDSKVTAAWHRNPCKTESAKQSAEHVVRSAHIPGKLLTHLRTA